MAKKKKTNENNLLALGLIAGAIYLFTKNGSTPPPGKVNLFVKVTDATTGAALAGVSVLEPGLSGTTDLSGNYNISLAPGNYTINFKKTGYIDQIKTVALVAEATQLNVYMQPAIQIPQKFRVYVSGFTERLPTADRWLLRVYDSFLNGFLDFGWHTIYDPIEVSNYNFGHGSTFAEVYLDDGVTAVGPIFSYNTWIPQPGETWYFIFNPGGQTGYMSK